MGKMRKLAISTMCLMMVSGEACCMLLPAKQISHSM